MTPDPLLTFSTFARTAGNREALDACRRLAASHARRVEPLLLCGPVATGKTHLLNALANELGRREPARVRLLACEAWVDEFVAALYAGSMNELRRRYGALDALPIDDTHVLAGKSQTQRELAYGIAPLALRGCRIAVAHGGPLEAVRPLLRAAKRSGTALRVVRIAKPAPSETRAIVSARYAAQRREIPSTVIDAVCRRARDVRCAVGTVNAIMARGE